MYGHGGKTTRLDRVLDAFASRIGIFSVVGFLAVLGVAVGLYVQSVVTQLEENHEAFIGGEFRNGYTAISDIQRLVLVAQKAAEVSGMPPARAEEFSSAADILYVRTEYLKKIERDFGSRSSARNSVAALETVINIADEAIANGFPDNPALVKALLENFDVARKHLVLFLDDMRRQQEAVLEAQTLAVHTQRNIVIANLMGLTLVGIAALMLLRREVLARRAREKAESDVAFLAYFDPLTQLPNRTQYQDRLAALLDDGQRVAMIHVDLDDFKIINDTFGHAAGDAVLFHVAGILSDNASNVGGFAARLGGDEFSLIVPDDNIPRLETLADAILRAVADPFRTDNELIQIGLSIGFATSTQISSYKLPTAETLSRVADFALYASKSNGRGRSTVYDQALEQRYLDRRSMLEELPAAIDNGDIHIFLQPKVNLTDGQVYGFEALARWMRNGAIVQPNEFISIAEENGMVIDIDNFVMQRAAELLSKWNHANGTEFSVSVNLSALHFNSRRIIQRVEDTLWTSLLPPHLLTLEITETVEMRDWAQAQNVIQELNELGSLISIDDFGTGFSSLAYLLTIKANELKIDRSLVAEVETSEQARLLLSSVLDIGKNLGMKVTVEGVENTRQRDIVFNLGARSAQGYYYGKPKPPEEALADAMAHNSPPKSNTAS